MIGQEVATDEFEQVLDALGGLLAERRHALVHADVAHLRAVTRAEQGLLAKCQAATKASDQRLRHKIEILLTQRAEQDVLLGRQLQTVEGLLAHLLTALRGGGSTNYGPGSQAVAPRLLDRAL